MSNVDLIIFIVAALLSTSKNNILCCLAFTSPLLIALSDFNYVYDRDNVDMTASMMVLVVHVVFLTLITYPALFLIRRKAINVKSQSILAPE